ncbi:LacI family DNA-binding transcriptional regulator [Ectobacillus ponti]|uniref:LacI family transcriptional regulator n=1 Tax=Ectobacillus ponti TaxID=2961894 RepID=A0AA42BRD8_9BACI|nr:LacI family DNA-binding transcriptional regulator [Ectobacillus ponti]MCP8971275.1 LacI family transcriptional regulator [Ectobacillus ponti]
MKLTIKDIAKMAGVSVSSVSRVINNSKPVNDEIRERVEKVIQETNFRPNALARGLIHKSTNLIGVIIPQVNSVSAHLINGIEEVAARNGYHIILSNSGSDTEQELKALDIFAERQVDGIILSSVDITEQHVQQMNRNKVPLVVVGQKTTEYGIPWVDVDNYQPVAEVVRYLVRCGHERIGMIYGPLQDQSAGLSRYQAFLDEMARKQLPIDPAHLVESRFTTKGGYEAMESLLRNESVPTALVCASDIIAIGAKNCAEDRGYLIPEDMSIVGFDDIELAALVRPQLTTVQVNIERMGTRSMEILLQTIEEQQLHTMEHYVDYRLMVRDSVKTIRKR